MASIEGADGPSTGFHRFRIQMLLKNLFPFTNHHNCGGPDLLLACGVVVSVSLRTFQIFFLSAGDVRVSVCGPDGLN